MKKVMVLTGGGDCPGLNAVIRAIVKRVSKEKGWKVIGCIESFNGVFKDPEELVLLDDKKVSGIIGIGGTIIGTTNKGGPLAWPIQKEDGTWTTIDRTDELIEKLKELGIDAVINIGGDGSQKISKILHDKGLNIVGVPKTIDNDLSATDYTFGFQTAVQTVTEAIDKLVTTASSHNRIFILEVMGRDAGWIALYSAIAGGADVCIIPEIPYDIKVVKDKIETKYKKDKGYCIVVIAEGAISKTMGKVGEVPTDISNTNFHLGGVGNVLKQELFNEGIKHDVRVSVLGHVQRGGSPIALDRVLASEFGVKAFELVLEEKFGQMVAYQHPDIVSVSFEEAISNYKLVSPDSSIVKTARGLGIVFGDN